MVASVLIFLVGYISVITHLQYQQILRMSQWVNTKRQMSAQQMLHKVITYSAASLSE